MDRAPARTRTRRWQATHDHLINVAASLFYAKGMHVVGVHTIAAEAGVTKATLYDHFPSKAQLIAESLDTLDRRYHDWFVREVSKRAESPLARLQAAFDVLDEWFQHPRFRGCSFINATVELADDSHPGRQAVRAHKARTVEFLRQLLDEAGLRDDELADQLMLIIEGATIVALVQEDPTAARRAARIAAALLASRSPGTILLV